MYYKYKDIDSQFQGFLLGLASGESRPAIRAHCSTPADYKSPSANIKYRLFTDHFKIHSFVEKYSLDNGARVLFYSTDP